MGCYIFSERYDHKLSDFYVSFHKLIKERGGKSIGRWFRTLRAAAGGGGSASYLLPPLHYRFLPLVHTGDTLTEVSFTTLPPLAASFLQKGLQIYQPWLVEDGQGSDLQFKGNPVYTGWSVSSEAEERRGGGDVKDV